jgi:hypothetical protein
MDMTPLLHPQIRDRESMQEFSDALSDYVPNIERDVARLKADPTDKLLISGLFRALHTIKGDAALCKVDMGVMIVHPIESMLARLRNGEIGFSNLLAESILLAIDRLVLATQSVLGSRPVDQLKLIELVNGFQEMAEAPANQLDAMAASLIKAVTGFRPVNFAVNTPRKAATLRPDTTTGDLSFFQSLALRHEARSPVLMGRSARLLHLAAKTNESAGNPVDPSQLEAAVYMHDIGMLFLPESLWLGTKKLGDVDKWLLNAHPGFSAGLLDRMEGWKPAAEMVLQHHERQDGTGYPGGLNGDQIVPGAKILAIIDTFESVALKYNEHGERRSMVRAIAEINASDDQFDPVWIAAFNTVVRKMIEG